MVSTIYFLVFHPWSQLGPFPGLPGWLQVQHRGWWNMVIGRTQWWVKACWELMIFRRQFLVHMVFWWLDHFPDFGVWNPSKTVIQYINLFYLFGDYYNITIFLSTYTTDSSIVSLGFRRVGRGLSRLEGSAEPWSAPQCAVGGGDGCTATGEQFQPGRFVSLSLLVLFKIMDRYPLVI